MKHRLWCFLRWAQERTQQQDEAQALVFLRWAQERTQQQDEAQALVFLQWAQERDATTG